MRSAQFQRYIFGCVSLLFVAYGAAFARDGAGESDKDLSLKEVLDEAIQDEYRSEQTYLKVIATFGRVRPFVNIVQAEGRHILALSRLHNDHGLAVPPSKWTQENVPTYESFAAACSDAVAAETENVAMYDRLLSQGLPSDVRYVLGNLQAASRDAHLPAFERCSALFFR
jgi:hypothetical protein